MLSATISADIIASSSLSAGEMKSLTERISDIFISLNEYQKNKNSTEFIWRLVLGDMIECFSVNPNDALRVALVLKSGIKSLRLEKDIKYDNDREKLRKLFEIYGVRVAIGVGDMDAGLLEQNVFKGSAINLSGRLIAEQKTSNKERVTVKNTLFIGSIGNAYTPIFQPVLSLLDTLFNKMTARQSEIVYMKLLGYSEQEIASEFEVTQSSVNQHSTSAGWNSIEEALNLFSTFNFNNFVSPGTLSLLQ